MDCLICRDLARVFEAGLREYIEARSLACSQVSTNLLATKNVDMERAKYELEEHRLVCASAIRALAYLPKRNVSTSFIQLAASFRAGFRVQPYRSAVAVAGSFPDGNQEKT